MTTILLIASLLYSHIRVAVELDTLVVTIRTNVRTIRDAYETYQLYDAEVYRVSTHGVEVDFASMETDP